MNSPLFTWKYIPVFQVSNKHLIIHLVGYEKHVVFPDKSKFLCKRIFTPYVRNFKLFQMFWFYFGALIFFYTNRIVFLVPNLILPNLDIPGDSWWVSLPDNMSFPAFYYPG